MKISRKTKSSAYRFIKSLMKDGAEGEDIHNLVSAISDNVSAEIGGEILSDLIRNSKDENADTVEGNYWFGPIDSSFYGAVADAWADHVEDTEIRGTLRIGGIKAWKKWNVQGGYGFSDEELETRQDKIQPQMIVFHWHSDAIVRNETNQFLSDLHDNLTKAIEEKNK